jgi:hypothetical protein
MPNQEQHVVVLMEFPNHLNKLDKVIFPKKRIMTYISIGIFSLSVLFNTDRLRVEPDKKLCKDKTLKLT